MRFCAVSDLHGNVSLVPKITSYARKLQCKFIIFCGDLTDFGTVDEGIEVLRTFSKSGLKTLYVPGNCDPQELVHVRVEGTICIHGKLIYMDDVGFIGVGGSSTTPFNTPFELDENEIWDLLRRAVSGVKDFGRIVLVSHDPPNNTALDLTFVGLHVGSKSIREFILKYRPLMGIHGHIHEGRGIDKLNGVLVINPGASINGYVAIVDIKETAKPAYRLLNIFSDNRI